MQTIEQTKEAVEKGQTVHWHSPAYTLRKDSKGRWWVDCTNGHIAPLLGHKPEDFYIAKSKGQWVAVISTPNETIEENLQTMERRIVPQKPPAMNAPHHYILSVETYDSGGCCPVDFINLKSGQILAIDSETIVLFKDIADFEDRKNVNRPSLELNA